MATPLPRRRCQRRTRRPDDPRRKTRCLANGTFANRGASCRRTNSGTHTAHVYRYGSTPGDGMRSPGPTAHPVRKPDRDKVAVRWRSARKAMGCFVSWRAERQIPCDLGTGLVCWGLLLPAHDPGGRSFLQDQLVVACAIQTIRLSAMADQNFLGALQERLAVNKMATGWRRFWRLPCRRWWGQQRLTLEFVHWRAPSELTQMITIRIYKSSLASLSSASQRPTGCPARTSKTGRNATPVRVAETEKAPNQSGLFCGCCRPDSVVVLAEVVQR